MTVNPAHTVPSSLRMSEKPDPPATAGWADAEEAIATKTAKQATRNIERTHTRRVVVDRGMGGSLMSACPDRRPGSAGFSLTILYECLLCHMECAWVRPPPCILTTNLSWQRMNVTSDLIRHPIHSAAQPAPRAGIRPRTESCQSTPPSRARRSAVRPAIRGTPLRRRVLRLRCRSRPPSACPC